MYLPLHDSTDSALDPLLHQCPDLFHLGRKDVVKLLLDPLLNDRMHPGSLQLHTPVYFHLERPNLLLHVVPRISHLGFHATPQRVVCELAHGRLVHRLVCALLVQLRDALDPEAGAGTGVGLGDANKLSGGTLHDPLHARRAAGPHREDLRERQRGHQLREAGREELLRPGLGPGRSGQDPLQLHAQVHWAGAVLEDLSQQHAGHRHDVGLSPVHRRCTPWRG
mmetsp:Transcript_56949/g.161683  ORF Transcript_56949/g.161683 Transcript_56949/m.161683 type:complete len:223 (-) Transcript_56949:54-722(-)